MTFLALGVLSLLLALTVGRRARGSAPVFWVGCAYLLPASLLAWTLFSSQVNATRFRFALLGWGFRSEEGANLTIPIGGDREKHRAWISALAEGPRGTRTSVGQLVFVPAPEDRESGKLTVEAATTSASGFLAVRRNRRSNFESPPIEPIESLQIQEGDRLTFLGRTWTVRLETGMFGPPARFLDAAGRPIDLPSNYAELPGGLQIPIERPPLPGEKTYPVAWLEKAMTRALPAGRPKAFFYRRADGYFGSSLWVAAPAGGLHIERAGQEMVIKRSTPMATGDTLHLVSFGHWNERGFPAGGMRDRRSLRVRAGRRGFALAFETPEIYVLPWSQVQDLAVPSMADAKGALLRVNLSMGDWQITDKSLHFDHASQKAAGESLAILELPENLGPLVPWRKETFSAATPRGFQRGTLGESTWLGGENRTAIQLDMISPPLGLAILALMLALAKIIAARGARLTGAQLLVAAVLETLVSLRILLGYRAWAMPPFSEEAYRLALVGWSLLPWAFLVACSPAFGREDLRVRERLPALAGLVFSMTWCFRIEGGGLRSLLWVLCHLGAVLLLARTSLLGTARNLFSRAASHLFAPLARRPVLLWTLAGWVPAFVRIGFLLIGAREGLRVGGQRFALTLVHVPLAIVLEAGYLIWLWRRVEQRGDLSWKEFVPVLSFVLGTWLGPSALVSDNGLALLHLPVFLIAVTVLGFALARRLSEEGGAGRGWTALPALALLGYLLLAAFPVGARLFVTVASKRVELASERNYLRLLEFAYPQQLQEIGLRASEELAVMSTVMQSYTSRPFQECRYFSSVISPHIRATALREHATAVLIAAEWSVAGTIGVALAYVALALCALSLRPWRSDDSDRTGMSVVIAQLAALTLAIPSLYMILANYRLTLFTGKNPYLLGLDSTADLLETLALAVLFALASAAVRAGEQDT